MIGLYRILIVVRRYDYDSICSELIIRIIIILYNTFASKLVIEIKKGFESLKKNQIETRPFVNKISLVSGVIYFEENGKKFKYVPDIRFYYKDTAFVEVEELN